jgi:hypothetical protein
MSKNTLNENNSFPWTTIIIGVLIIVASVFCMLWYGSNYNYTILEQEYVALQDKYQSLLVQYETLSSNSSLVQAYEQLESKYHSFINTVANAESYTTGDNAITLVPGGYVIYPIVVPNGCNATVNIEVDSLYVVNVYVITLSSMNAATSSLTTSSILHNLTDEWTGGLEKTITLESGVYIIELANPPPSEVNIGAYVTITTSLQCK